MAAEEVNRLNEICLKMDESPNVVSKILEYLINKGAVYKESQGMYKIVDSVFARWIELQFR